jgi:DNA-binding response OmpR family regulator
VVDDLAASAETLMTLLELEGFEVRVASEGMAALKIAEEFHRTWCCWTSACPA